MTEETTNKAETTEEAKSNPDDSQASSAQTETESPEQTGKADEDDGSFLDDMIESIEEITEPVRHFLFRPLFGRKDED